MQYGHGFDKDVEEGKMAWLWEIIQQEVQFRKEGRHKGVLKGIVCGD